MPTTRSIWGALEAHPASNFPTTSGKKSTTTKPHNQRPAHPVASDTYPRDSQLAPTSDDESAIKKTQTKKQLSTQEWIQ